MPPMRLRRDGIRVTRWRGRHQEKGALRRVRREAMTENRRRDNFRCSTSRRLD